MGNIKLLRILYIIISVSLLFMVTPAAPVQADGAITLSPAEGKIGDPISIKGEGFNKSTGKIDKFAAIYFSSDEATTLDYIDKRVNRYELVGDAVWLDQMGEFQFNFEVPDQLNDGSREEKVTSGTYYVYVCHYYGTVIVKKIVAVAEFTVVRGEILLNPEKGPVDTLLEITGKDFIEEEEINIDYDGDKINIQDGDVKTNRFGEFFSVVRIPESTAGTHNVTASVGGNQVEAGFIVEPDIALNRQSGEPDTEITVSGTGFDKMKAVDILFNGTAVTTETTDILGSFYASFYVPELQAGIYEVSAEDGLNTGKELFTVIVPPPPPAPPPPRPSASVSISENSGNVGQVIELDGTGFAAGAIVSIDYDKQLLTAANTDSEGVFTTSFTVPVAEHGDHSITVSDGENTLDISFTVESVPPPTPVLVLPEMDGKVKPPVNFSWQEVTDPSAPVRYTLQVASRLDFSVNSILLEKKGLTEAAYSLGSEESPGLLTGKTPFYWRVRAVDAASNEGQWAGPWVFYIATGISDWTKYAIIFIVLVLLVIFFIIYIMRRGSKKKKEKLTEHHTGNEQ